MTNEVETPPGPAAMRPIQIGFGGILALAVTAPVLAATGVVLLAAVGLLGLVACVVAAPFVGLIVASEKFHGWRQRRRFLARARRP